MGDYLTKLPTVETLAPRDDCCNIFDSKDLLFLAGILSNKLESLWIYKFEKNNRSIFLLEKDGLFFHPFYHTPIIPDENTKFIRKIHLRLIRSHFSNKFYPYRRLIHKNVASGYKNYHEDILEPVKLVDDKFIHHLFDQKFLDFDLSVVVPPGYAICPYCSIVKPFVQINSSADITWKLLVGRKYGYVLCPHCLGEFASRLLSMS
ncbi:MAG TPA: hypothetical protein PLZ43_13275 [bacterium]|nr:hypothetical protein [bacterium]